GEQVADPARLVIGRRAMICAAEDELLVLGSDRPRLRRLLASCEGGEQIVAAFDKALGLAPGFRARSHEAPLAAPGLAAPVPRRRHPQADRGERRGVGAKDARAERYGLRLRQG